MGPRSHKSEAIDCTQFEAPLGIKVAQGRCESGPDAFSNRWRLPTFDKAPTIIPLP